MTFVLASNNKKKIAELRRIIKEISETAELVTLSDIGYTDEIVEDGDTFEKNALIKARVPASLGYIGIADDSGICIDALGGVPGVYSARWSGMGDEANNDKLLSELKDVPEEKRGAHYACAIACVFPEKMGIESIVTFGRCYGTIIKERRGDGGFGYDPLFFCPEYDRTMAELTAEEKDAISHRGAALREFAEKIKPIIRKLENET